MKKRGRQGEGRMEREREGGEEGNIALILYYAAWKGQTGGYDMGINRHIMSISTALEACRFSDLSSESLMDRPCPPSWFLASLSCASSRSTDISSSLARATDT
jgi:hypothetical protein